MSEVTDLVVIEKQNAMAVFTTKEQLDPIIEAIEKEARSLVPDVSTRKGRDAIASMAHKVARSKTYIDNAGKDLVAELKAAGLCRMGRRHLSDPLRIRIARGHTRPAAVL